MSDRTITPEMLREGRRLLDGYVFADDSDAHDLSAADIWVLENGAALLAAAEQLEAAKLVIEAAQTFREQAIHGEKMTAITELDASLAAARKLGLLSVSPGSGQKEPP